MSGAVGTRRVVVTGGGSGIGREVALRIVREGGVAVVVGRRAELLNQLAQAHPGKIHAVPCDLADANARRGLLARATALVGHRLDGLVLSAGAVTHELAGSISDEALREQLELNLVANLRLSEEALTVLEDGGGVVMVGSTLAQRPIPTSAVYSATKAGLLAAMQSFAQVGASRRLRFNAVTPGVVDTELVRRPRLSPGETLDPAGSQARVEATLKTLAGLHPLGRLGTPGDVAEAVFFLLGAPWVTGSNLIVDGGQLISSGAV